MAKKKDFDYYQKFNEAIDISYSVAQKLEELVSRYSPEFARNDLPDFLKEVHKLEHEGDQIYRNIIKELNVAFITPIDREDIILIAKAIDDITDSIEDVAFRFWMFNVNILQSDTKVFVDMIVKACYEARYLLGELRNFKKSDKITSYIQNVDQIEYEGDMIYREAIHQLFAGSDNPVHIQKWRELYHDMENCLDKCHDLARAVEDACVKNS